MATRLKRMNRESQDREAILSGLYALSHGLLGLTSVQEVRAAASIRLNELTRANCSILLRREISAEDEAARSCLALRMPVGAGTANLPHASDLVMPLIARDLAFGVLRFSGVDGSQFPSHRFSSKVLATLTAQTAIALDKACLAEAHAAELQKADRERFMSALLSSVSHDFKTPLVTIIGAFSALTLKDAAPKDAELISSGLEEAQRLNRYVNNLVEISRFEAGLSEGVGPPLLLHDAISSALRALRPIIDKQSFRVDIGPGFPLLNVSPALLELVLINLIENALKYGPDDGVVSVVAEAGEQRVTIDVDDDGAGIPHDLRGTVFQKFYRAEVGDRKVSGTGLGLYICKEIVESWGGTVCAIDPPDGTGACMRITLPIDITTPLAPLLEELEG